MRTFVLVRHGQSEFNAENRFTGRIDSPLCVAGVEEAHRAGRILRTSGFRFDRIHSSVLVRCTESARIIREELGEPDVPIIASGRLNERHTERCKDSIKPRRQRVAVSHSSGCGGGSYDVRPPASRPRDNRDVENNPRYADLQKSDVPLTESPEIQSNAYCHTGTRKSLLPSAQASLC